MGGRQEYLSQARGVIETCWEPTSNLWGKYLKISGSDKKIALKLKMSVMPKSSLLQITLDAH